MSVDSQTAVKPADNEQTGQLLKKLNKIQNDLSGLILTLLIIVMEQGILLSSTY